MTEFMIDLFAGMSLNYALAVIFLIPVWAGGFAFIISNIMMKNLNLFDGKRFGIAGIVSYIIFGLLFVPLSTALSDTRETKIVKTTMLENSQMIEIDAKVCRVRETIKGEWMPWTSC